MGWAVRDRESNPAICLVQMGFFVLLLAALTGTMLPIVYFFHRRFPSGPPAESNVIVRQAMWFGVYGLTLAWLQLGRLVTVYVVLGSGRRVDRSRICHTPARKITLETSHLFR